MRQDISTCRQLLEENPDLALLAKIASRKGIASLVYQRLKPYFPQDSRANNALHQLQAIYLTNCIKNQYYKEELVKVLKFFWENHLAVIPLKGMNLSQRLYADIVSRDQSADIDLLVQEKDKQRARKLLETLGYTFLPVDEIKAYQWYYLFHKAGFKPIELHWDVTMMARSQRRIEGFWQGAEVVDWEGAKFYDFHPEELLLYLSVHLVNSDSFCQLRYVCDIGTLLYKYKDEINWRALVEKAKKWQLNGSTYAALVLNRDFFGLNFPQTILKQLGVSLFKRLFIRVFANKKVVLRQGLRRRILDHFLSYVFFEFTAAVSPREYLAIFQRIFFPFKQKVKILHLIFNLGIIN